MQAAKCLGQLCGGTQAALRREKRTYKSNHTQTTRARTALRKKWGKRRIVSCADGNYFDKESFQERSNYPRVTLISSDWIWSPHPETNTTYNNTHHSRYPEFSGDEHSFQQGGSATFYISAWNGRDPSRTLCLSGFCLSVKSLVTSVSQAVREIGGEIASLDKENRSQVIVTALEDTSESSSECDSSHYKPSDEMSPNKVIVIDQYTGKRAKAAGSDVGHEDKQGIILLNAPDYGILENDFTTSFIVLDHVNLVISLPMLWGIPPTHRVLKPAIRTAGGVVEKVSHSWKLV